MQKIIFIIYKCKCFEILKILYISTHYNYSDVTSAYDWGREGHRGMSRDRYKNTLATAGCCPFDSPFPAIVVFLSARASTSFLSLLSLASFFFLPLSLSFSFFHSLTQSSPRTSYDPGRIFLLFQPFLFCPRRSQPSHAPSLLARLFVCVCFRKGEGTRVRAWR